MTQDCLAHSKSAEAFCADLYAAFGAHFELWAKFDSWRPAASPETADDGQGRCTGPDRHTVDAMDRAINGDRRPATVRLPNGRWLLAASLPQEYRDECELVATAGFSTDRPDLLERTASLVIDAFGRSRQLAQSRRQMESYARSLSRSLEELAYLAACTEQLDALSAHGDAFHIAQLILPRLQKTVSAEAVVLLPVAETGTTNVAVNQEQCYGPIWAGKRVINDAACWALVRRFGEESRLRAVVKNYFVDSADRKVLECVENFVLTPVVNGESPLGWLLALNRSARINEDLTKLKRTPAGLSDLEFGTVEASLLQFTAVLLAAHDGRGDRRRVEPPAPCLGK